MGLTLLERHGDVYSLTFYITDAGRAERCPRFTCEWGEARELLITMGELALAERARRAAIAERDRPLGGVP